MDSARDFIQLSVKHGKLNQLFSELLSEIPKKIISIHEIDVNDPDAVDKLYSRLDNDEILVTSDNYIDEPYDYQVLNHEGHFLLTVNEDGSIINNRDQAEYLDDSLCDNLASIYNKLHDMKTIYVVSDDD